MSDRNAAPEALSLTTAELIENFASTLVRSGQSLFLSFHRLWKSRPYMAPKEPGEDAYRAWLSTVDPIDAAASGISYDYADIAELCGWDVAEKETVARYDHPPVEIASPVEPEPVVIPPAPREPALPGAAAAREFLTWLRANDLCNTYSATELGDLYETHCAETNRVETAQNTLLKHLRKQPGVYTCTKDNVEASFLEGRRVRYMMWTFAREAGISTGSNGNLRLAA